MNKKMTILEATEQVEGLKQISELYWQASCPLKKEAGESFTVTPHRDIFYCFDCHAGGGPEEFFKAFHSTKVWE